MNPNSSSFCVGLPGGRSFTVPALLPVAVIVIVLVALGHDLSAAVAALVAMVAATRETGRSR
ncbi:MULTISPECIES: hypothetical protein [Streptomyces]|uniref:Uncharacterized protein n=1 Tax=Streptomyces yangpuensis TaxID=1648182 RepID=A0ABY5PP19_9ACTN|nr:MULTISPECIES: hypothetical protein [Streptomyces]MBZ9593733.1 hypothetical protein [Streptomyces erythrochromogenes]UUY45801.1 hypothetical protein NRK68_00385 [Streptomyces yangpuensis]